MSARLAIALLFVLAATLLQGQEFVIGARLPDIDVIDDTGRVRSTAEWRGVPTILAPLYSRCPVACPMIVKGVLRGAAESQAKPESYRVVLFSFDPKDGPDDLRRLREQQKVPLAWTIAAAAHPGDARRMLDAIGYRYAEERGHFIHPNAIIALTPDLVTAKFLLGTKYDLDAALDAARGGRDWIGLYGGWMLAILLLACLLSAVWLVTLIATRTAERRRPAG